MDAYKRLLLENRSWIQERKILETDFFLRTGPTQHPRFLWIGCCDSRVSPNEITHTEPGEIFVHRNIANLVNQNDINLMSVLEYAVDVLDVKHIIVCGHYGCGGIIGAMDGLEKNRFTFLPSWLNPLISLYDEKKGELSSSDLTNQQKTDRFVIMNVIEQIENLKKCNVLYSLKSKNKQVHLHGWVYQPTEGLLEQIIDEIF